MSSVWCAFLCSSFIGLPETYASSYARLSLSPEYPGYHLCRAPEPPVLQPQGLVVVGGEVLGTAGCRVFPEVGANQGAALRVAVAVIVAQPVCLYKFFSVPENWLNAVFSCAMHAM